MTNAIETALKRAFKDMDPHTGMFPEDWTCLRCGKVLNADGGHPAELYAGTFTGLCYPCTSAGPFVVSIAELDGAQKVSWPPHCPAWRRDRETFYGYPDCETCKGFGVAGARRGYQAPRLRCEACSNRYWHHPRRAWASARDSLIHKAAEARYQRLMDQAALAALGTKRASRKRISEAIAALPVDEVAAIRTAVLAKFDPLRKRHSAITERIYAASPPPPPTPKQHQLVWTPQVSKDGYRYAGEPEILHEGTLEECRERWTAFMVQKGMFETDPDRYPAIGLLRTEGALNSVFLIPSGSLTLLSPDRKD